jgi:hypothetical protein
MSDKNTPPIDNAAWEAAYRARIIPLIYARYEERQQTREEANQYIAGTCFEHPKIRLAALFRSWATKGS